MTIITGGQRGVDWGVMRACAETGTPARIRTFCGYRPRDGARFPDDWKVEYLAAPQGLMDVRRLLAWRTRENVKHADMVVLLVDRPLEETKGSALTWRLAAEYEIVHAAVDLARTDCGEKIAGLLRTFSEAEVRVDHPGVVLFAGPRDANEDRVATVVREALIHG